MKLEQFFQFIEEAIVYFAREENTADILQAQKIYGQEVAEISKDDSNYDLCMERFYDWFLFAYRQEQQQKRYIDTFLELKGGDEELAAIIATVKPSLWEFYQSRFFKKNVFKNLLSAESLQLHPDHPQMIFVDGDLLLGHAGLLDGKLFFLPGINALCRQAKKVILRESKWVRKQKNSTIEELFLNQLELFDLRYRHYQHVAPEKIYTFKYE